MRRSFGATWWAGQPRDVRERGGQNRRLTAGGARGLERGGRYARVWRAVGLAARVGLLTVDLGDHGLQAHDLSGEIAEGALGGDQHALDVILVDASVAQPVGL